MASNTSVWLQAKNGTCSAAAPEVVPEAQPGPLQQLWPELGKPKAAKAAVPGGVCRGTGDAQLKATTADMEEEEPEDAEDGQLGTESPVRRRRRRRRHRRSSLASQATTDAATSNAQATSGSEDEALNLCPRNVVTWNDLLGKDHGLKPESPSGGFQCATAACWGRFATQQLQQQQRQLPELQDTQHQMQTSPPPVPLQQQQLARIQFWDHQQHQEPALSQLLLQPPCCDNGSSKVVPLTPASFGDSVQWLVTDAPRADWSSCPAEDLRTWLDDSMQSGGVLLSELDLMLQTLSSETYKD